MLNRGKFCAALCATDVRNYHHTSGSGGRILSLRFEMQAQLQAKRTTGKPLLAARRLFGCNSWFVATGSAAVVQARLQQLRQTAEKMHAQQLRVLAETTQAVGCC